jgi:branched-chain amino acid transport system substrate-binding protein
LGDQARSTGLRDTQQIEAILDVAASATDLAAIDVAKAKHKIIVLNGPGTARNPTKPVRRCCITPVMTVRRRTETGEAMVKARHLVFITADDAFERDLEQNPADIVATHGGKV